MKSSSVSLVIPIHNNESTVVAGVLACKKILSRLTGKYEILLGEDASTDNTRTLLGKHFAKDPHIRLFMNEINQGIGKNIYLLYTQAKYDYTALFSIDGDWEVDDLSKLIVACLGKKADVVIGKRIKKVGYSTQRQIFSLIFNFLPKYLLGVDTIDAGSIKVFKTKLFQTMNILSRSQFFEAEFIIKVKKMGGTIISLPVHYHKKLQGRGGWLRFVDALNAFWDFLRVWMQS